MKICYKKTKEDKTMFAFGMICVLIIALSVLVLLWRA
jgi:hypothetical protein